MLTALPVLADSFGRSIQYLRISVTDRCNLRCVYCMPEHGVPYENQTEILSVGEIMKLVRLLTPHGLRKVRITGGEPLVRGSEVVDLVAELTKTPGIEDVGLTTNAVCCSPPRRRRCARPDCRRINISLDTLRPERFAKIARFSKFEEAQAGIDAAVEAGFAIKLNTVLDARRERRRDRRLRPPHPPQPVPGPLPGVHAHRPGPPLGVESQVRLQPGRPRRARPAHGFQLDPVSTDEASTSRVFRIPGALGTIGVISPMSHRFCAGCNRLRLTANGMLVPCLSDNFEYDLKTPLRAGESDAALLGHVQRRARPEAACNRISRAAPSVEAAACGSWRRSGDEEPIRRFALPLRHFG